MDENNGVISQIEKIINIAKDNNLSDFSFETKEMKISFKFTENTKPNSEETSEEISQSEADLESQHFIIRSPLVGVFYKSPSPSAPPFVEVGDVIEKGETICIIEAMKVMNEITAEKKGKIVKVFPKNGEMVEFDSPLFEMEAVPDEA